MVDALARGHYVRLAVTASGSAMGFVEASKRVDYVNGTSSSPVAFLEGLYVAPKSRRKGIARALVESVVKWASTEGCLELASDFISSRRNDCNASSRLERPTGEPSRW
jgi:aminoglycoside 6'-N-acetyltransferase I